MYRLDAGFAARLEERLNAFMTERLDHTWTV
jgi:hypothetical protein